MKTARTRAGGLDREYIAAKNAMSTTGVEFHPALPCSCEAMLPAKRFVPGNQLSDIFNTDALQTLPEAVF